MTNTKKLSPRFQFSILSLTFLSFLTSFYSLLPSLTVILQGVGLISLEWDTHSSPHVRVLGDGVRRLKIRTRETHHMPRFCLLDECVG